MALSSAPAPFVDFRYKHALFIFLPRTVHGAYPNVKDDHEYREDFIEAAFDSVPMNSDVSWCADAINAFVHGS